MKNKFIVISSVLLLILSFAANSYALDLEKARVDFLKGDYPEAIKECENILAYKGYSKDLDELYYILGLSYMKQENYLRASDIFEIIINEFKDSSFKDDAMLGLGDTYLLRGDYTAAETQYKTFLNTQPQTKLKPVVYYRLAQVSMKQGSQKDAQGYMDKIKKEYPLSFESRIQLTVPQDNPVFLIQVGAFSKNANADNLCQILVKKGYKAYIEDVSTGSAHTYKVRVGKLASRFEAEQLQRQLANDGYPTKIFP